MADPIPTSVLEHLTSRNESTPKLGLGLAAENALVGST
jgi:hypothetical protein